MRISDWSSDVCSSDLVDHKLLALLAEDRAGTHRGIAAGSRPGTPRSGLPSSSWTLRARRHFEFVTSIIFLCGGWRLRSERTADCRNGNFVQNLHRNPP